MVTSVCVNRRTSKHDWHDQRKPQRSAVMYRSNNECGGVQHRAKNCNWTVEISVNLFTVGFTHTVGQTTASHHMSKKFAALSRKRERLSAENLRRRRNLGASFYSTIKVGFVVIETCQFSSSNESAMLVVCWKNHDDVVI